MLPTERANSIYSLSIAWPRLLVFITLFLAGIPAVSAESTDSGEESGLKLLFVGNSLTYTNDLPEMLSGLLQWEGIDVARVHAEARPDFGLQDHWSSKTTHRAIASDDWDLVIFQQGPSATEGRPSLLEFSTLFAPEVRAIGAQPVLYMVWPSAARLRDFPGVAESYRMAAIQIDGSLFPVGEAWMWAWRQNPRLKLYGRDGFHPSRLGTYLAALVMFQQITGRDPTTLPSMIPGLRKGDPVEPELARLLQNAAASANENSGIVMPCLIC